MGGIGEKRPLSVDELLQAVGHLVDGLAEGPELSRSALDLRSLGQSAGADRGDGCLDVLEWAGERPRDERTEGGGNGEHTRSEDRQD